VTDARLRVTGEVDGNAAPRLRARLREVVDAVDGDVLVDCSELEFLDSDGVVPLIEAQHALSARSRNLVLFNLRDAPRRKLEILGLRDYLAGDPS
jgi:anti-anti-sigma factor